MSTITIIVGMHFLEKSSDLATERENNEVVVELKAYSCLGLAEKEETGSVKRKRKSPNTLEDLLVKY